MQSHNKLVRDFIPRIILAEGKQCFWNTIENKEDYRRQLRMNC